MRECRKSADWSKKLKRSAIADGGRSEAQRLPVAGVYLLVDPVRAGFEFREVIASRAAGQPASSTASACSSASGVP